MNKSDLINLLEEACGGRCNAEYNPCAYKETARELRDMKPVGVFAYDEENKVWEELIKGSEGTTLYALGESNE